MKPTLVLTAVNSVEPIPGTHNLRVGVTMTEQQRRDAAAALLQSMTLQDLEGFLREICPELMGEPA